ADPGTIVPVRLEVSLRQAQLRQWLWSVRLRQNILDGPSLLLPGSASSTQPSSYAGQELPEVLTPQSMPVWHRSSGSRVRLLLLSCYTCGSYASVPRRLFLPSG